MYRSADPIIPGHNSREPRCSGRNVFLMTLVILQFIQVLAVVAVPVIAFYFVNKFVINTLVIINDISTNMDSIAADIDSMKSNMEASVAYLAYISDYYVKLDPCIEKFCAKLPEMYKNTSPFR